MNIKKLFVVVSIFIFINTASVFADEMRIASELSQDQFDLIRDIIVKAETFRGSGGKSTKFVMEVVDTLGETVKATTGVEAYINLVEDSGKIRRDVLVQILTGVSAPSRILQKDVNMWFYKPGTQNALRISPAQRLLGGASYADVSSTNYIHFYDPIKMEDVILGDKEVYDITLKKVKNGVAYDSIHFFVDKQNNRPLKADFFTPSGKKLKSMYFRKFGNLNGVEISQQWVIVDGLNNKAITYINIKNISNEALPQSVFTTEGMKNL